MKYNLIPYLFNDNNILEEEKPNSKIIIYRHWIKTNDKNLRNQSSYFVCLFFSCKISFSNKLHTFEVLSCTWSKSVSPRCIKIQLVWTMLKLHHSHTVVLLVKLFLQSNSSKFNPSWYVKQKLAQLTLQIKNRCRKFCKAWKIKLKKTTTMVERPLLSDAVCTHLFYYFAKFCIGNGLLVSRAHSKNITTTTTSTYIYSWKMRRCIFLIALSYKSASRLVKWFSFVQFKNIAQFVHITFSHIQYCI